MLEAVLPLLPSVPVLADLETQSQQVFLPDDIQNTEGSPIDDVFQLGFGLEERMVQKHL